MIPPTVESIGSKALSGTSIVEILLPNSLKQLGCGCFGQYLVEVRSLLFTQINRIAGCCFAHSQIKVIEIPSKVTVICSQAFQFCQSLVSVIFEDASCLINIASEAFSWTGLLSLSLPESLQEIGDEAFRGTHLSEIDIPQGIQKLGDRVFADCAKLKTVRFVGGSGFNLIGGKRIFEGTTGCHVTIADNISKSVENLLPVGCSVSISKDNKLFVVDEPFVYSSDRTTLVRCFRNSSLVHVPRCVKKIGRYCFDGCKNISEICFENGSQLEKLSKYSFRHVCLTKLTVPCGVKTIGRDVFVESVLEYLDFEDGSQLTTISESIGSVENLKIPANVSSVEAEALVGVKKITVDPNNQYFSADDHFLFNHDQTELVFMFDVTSVDIVIPKHVQVLCEGCFLGRHQVRMIDFELESELRVIQSRALSDTSIIRFVVPMFVEEICECGFSGCGRLQEVVIPDECRLTSITCGMFEGTHLKTVFISSNIRHIEANSLRGIDNVELSAKQTYFSKVSKEFLLGCGISILGHVVSEHVFAFDSDVVSIPVKEFSGAKWLEGVSFPNCSSIRCISKSAFRESNLRSIAIPSSVEEIGDNAFNYCRKLTSVAFAPSSVLLRLPRGAFCRSGIQRICIPCNIQVIDVDCFNGTGLYELNFVSVSQLRRIEDNAFKDTKIREI